MFLIYILLTVPIFIGELIYNRQRKKRLQECIQFDMKAEELFQKYKEKKVCNLYLSEPKCLCDVNNGDYQVSYTYPDGEHKCAFCKRPFNQNRSIQL
jgi:hypothetical protein